MTAFQVRRGTNISHWLSQSQRRGAARRAFFVQADVRRLADWGFDHLRLPIDEEQLWDDRGAPIPEAFDLLDSALDWCADAGLRAIVDLHILRSHYFNQADEPALYRDPAALERMTALWRDLSRALARRAPDRVAYELLNEPVARRHEDWNRVAGHVFAAVRALEPERVLVLGSNRWQAPLTFDALVVPDDPRVLLSFHYYRPMLLTHYRASWCAHGPYQGPVRYPGQPVDAADLARLDEPLRGLVAGQNASHDAAAMSADLARPLAVRQATGLPLYCGEFGCLNTAPAADRAAWYRDLIGVLNAHGIAWANWDYRGHFGLVNDAGAETGVRAWLGL